ncbi:hypothetical protein [Nocardia sp. NPDC049707]|uniref:hypothetical protein n=1 Tax=Nocardia sp. NPDC049707 TaxID=3154735 RepID=UPI00341E58D5
MTNLEQLIAAQKANGRGLLRIELHHPDGNRVSEINANVNPNDMNPDRFPNSVLNTATDMLMQAVRAWALDDQENAA